MSEPSDNKIKIASDPSVIVQQFKDQLANTPTVEGHRSFAVAGQWADKLIAEGVDPEVLDGAAAKIVLEAKQAMRDAATVNWFEKTYTFVMGELPPWKVNQVGKSTETYQAASAVHGSIKDAWKAGKFPAHVRTNLESKAHAAVLELIKNNEKLPEAERQMLQNIAAVDVAPDAGHPRICVHYRGDNATYSQMDFSDFLEECLKKQGLNVGVTTRVLFRGDPPSFSSGKLVDASGKPIEPKEP